MQYVGVRYSFIHIEHIGVNSITYFGEHITCLFCAVLAKKICSIDCNDWKA